MAVKGRIRQLAVLVNTMPETLAEVMGDMSREALNELQAYNPKACGRMVRSIRRHRKLHTPLGAGVH
ncbi:MAG: hypothetical protein MUC88_08510 [Planctomycetes bacterium]|nr:hypothetical protein [Planctomycetota bacterium]